MELLNCPFCGCEATISRSYGQYRAHCLKRFKSCPVNMRTHDCNTREEAVSDWNRRAQDPLAEKVVEAAEVLAVHLRKGGYTGTMFQDVLKAVSQYQQVKGITP